MDGRLTGKVTGPGGGEIIDADGKAQAVRDQCAQLGCATEKSIVLGDGANDLKMMALAGISVAYRAKPVVRDKATFALSHAGARRRIELVRRMTRGRVDARAGKALQCALLDRAPGSLQALRSRTERRLTRSPPTR